MPAVPSITRHARRYMRIRKWLAAAMLMSGATVWASEYLTNGADPGRTGWMKDEKVFTTANVKDMKLLWKIKLESTPREMHNLFNPLVAERVTTPQGAREMAVVAGVSDDLFGIDVASGEMMWKKHFDTTFTAGGGRGSTLCPGGQTAVPAVVQTSPGKYTVYAVSWDGRLWQKNLSDGEDVAPPEKFMPPNGKPYALNLVDGVIYTASAQGCGGVQNAFYSFDLATRKSSMFLPAGGGLWGRRGAAVSPEGVIYLGTGDAQYNPATKSLGNAIVAVKLDANKQLQLADYFAAPNSNWLWRRDLDVNVTPMAFDYKGKKFLVGTSKECKVWLLDRDALGGEDHRTALYTTPLLCNDDAAFDARGAWGSMAAWQDARGTQWVLVPFWGPVSRNFHAPIEYGRPQLGGVGAYKLEEKAGKWQLTPAWLSTEMNMAEEVIVANGVVFAYGSGEDATQTVQDNAWDAPGGGRFGGGLDSSAGRRIPNSGHATLFALDAQTGKELWSSGNQITSWNHFSGLTVANGRAYLGTFDGTLYCFGVVK
jgi:outer membrane protein assembly factor BamB